nr:type III toxin-antitoxin system ToxN/AbiQ family toxin [uncultured Oribacterium sp.]
MNFEEFRFVFIDTEYLKYLRGFDPEIFFSSNTDYSKKPHLGILTNCNGRKYVIPLTSVKQKHIPWGDVTATNYRIYEEIDIRSAKTDQYDIIVDESDFNKLRQRNIPEDEFIYHKKRILSVLEIKKMFPVMEGVYTYAELSTKSANLEEEQRRNLMIKEYFFCKKIKAQIENKAKKIYEKQMQSGVVAQYHCNYQLLETAADAYKKEVPSDN